MFCFPELQKLSLLYEVIAKLRSPGCRVCIFIFFNAGEVEVQSRALSVFLDDHAFQESGSDTLYVRLRKCTIAMERKVAKFNALKPLTAYGIRGLLNASPQLNRMPSKIHTNLKHVHTNLMICLGIDISVVRINCGPNSCLSCREPGKALGVTMDWQCSTFRNH